MRWKIIIVNSAVLVIVGLLSFVLLKAGLDPVLSSNRVQLASDAERALRSANLQFELDGLRVERWLAGRAAEQEVRQVFTAGIEQARSEDASLQTKRLRDAAGQSPELASTAIAVVLFLDAGGVVLGPIDSSQLRGEDLRRQYPSLLAALASGQTSTQLWLSSQRSEPLQASYAPVRGEGGQVVGLLVAGVPLDDERLRFVSQATSGQALAIATSNGAGGIEVIAQAAASPDRAELDALREPAVSDLLAASLEGGLATFEAARGVYAAEPLAGHDARDVLLVAAFSPSFVPSAAALLWPLATVVLLGILLVTMSGVFLGNYISEPISEIEEGLLRILNGRDDHRFGIEHPELGGLVFRLNLLLDARTGNPAADANGRTSQPPHASYREAEGP